MSAILIVSTPSDVPTAFGYYWLKRYARYAAKHGHTVIFLRTANLKSFRDALVKYNPRLVILNGHGGSKGIELNNHILLGVVDYDPELGRKIYRQNPHWMSGRICLLLTCHTGKELAHRLIDYGALAVAAFKDTFIFLSEENHVNPAYDKLAYPFFISLLQLPLHLASNNSFDQACRALRNAFKYYRNEAERKGEELQAKYLHFDLTNFIALGDMGVTL